MGQTNAGIYWVRDSLPATVKLLLHEWWAQQLLKKGITEEEILSNPQAMPTIRRQPHNNEFQDFIDYMVPDFKEYFDSRSTGHVNGYGRALTDRTTHSLRKGEARRFREDPEWSPVRTMVLDHLKKEEPIEPYHRYASHEELVRRIVRDRPGVYLNVSSEGREWFYLGESEDVSKRNLGHRNGDMFLVRVYITQSKSDAKNLQDALYGQLERLDQSHRIIKHKRIPDGRSGCWGATRLDNGINSIEIIDGLVDTYYKEWCRAKAGVIS